MIGFIMEPYINDIFVKSKESVHRERDFEEAFAQMCIHNVQTQSIQVHNWCQLKKNYGLHGESKKNWSQPWEADLYWKYEVTYLAQGWVMLEWEPRNT